MLSILIFLQSALGPANFIDGVMLLYPKGRAHYLCVILLNQVNTSSSAVGLIVL